MNDERMVEERAARHAALGDPARLRIVDSLAVGDASPSELSLMLAMPSNLLAHHLKVLQQANLVVRTRSEGDRRRSYLRLLPEALDVLARPPVRAVPRVLFVCTANSARSHLAASLWRRATAIPAASAGTHPAGSIAPGAVAAAGRHNLPLPRIQPRHISEVRAEEDFVVTVCDRAHEELDITADAHWSVPDPLRTGTPEAFEGALGQLSHRVQLLAPLLAPA